MTKSWLQAKLQQSSVRTFGSGGSKSGCADNEGWRPPQMFATYLPLLLLQVLPTAGLPIRDTPGTYSWADAPLQ